MKFKFKLIIFVFLLVFTISFSVQALPQTLPAEIIEIINDSKQNTADINLVKERFEEYLYDFKDLSGQVSPEKIIVEQSGKQPYFITTEKAIADVNFLFNILKYGYAGYQYFGGDKKFTSTRNEIITAIEKKGFLSRITVNSFNKILYENLRFIQDGHFLIGNRGLMDKYYYFTAPRFDFFRDEKGYYTELEGEKAYLIAVDDGDYKEYLKPSLNDKGEVIYRLGTISRQEDKYIKFNTQLQPINSKEVKEVHTVLIKQNQRYSGNKSPYSVKIVEGIPVIEHRTARANPANIDKLEQFAEEGDKYSQEEIIIIDLRGNSGGSDLYAADWFEKFTGVEAGEGMVYCSLATETANRMLENTFKMAYKMERSDLDERYRSFFQNTESGWTEIEYKPNETVNNDNLVIVLIGPGVASAGESFVGYLRNLKNVIFMGTNTTGLVNFGNMGICSLPNSRTEVMFCKSISLYPDFVFREGKGYNPDIWINPSKAEELAFKFIKNYFEN